jgi:hypothetical protein
MTKIATIGNSEGAFLPVNAVALSKISFGYTHETTDQ